MLIAEDGLVFRTVIHKGAFYILHKRHKGEISDEYEHLRHAFEYGNNGIIHLDTPDKVKKRICSRRDPNGQENEEQYRQRKSENDRNDHNK